MALNFAIKGFRRDEMIVVDMIGDFDGSSAFELINYVNDRCGKDDTVLVETSHLKHIHPFGRKILQRKAHQLKAKVKNLIFSGRNKREVSPE